MPRCTAARTWPAPCWPPPRCWPARTRARGATPANLDAVAEAIAGLGEAALALDGSLRALEVNPLWVNGDQVEALDVLVITEARDQP